MRVYHFSEQPYPEAWDIDVESLRVTLPNRLCDPARASQLLNERLDEWVLCDELGLNIMVNEHHSTATCLSVSATVTLAMLARQTKRARLLGLGFPIGLRPDPVRLAEEIAYIDVVSGGRLDIGFVRGMSPEIAPSNANPAHLGERYWDAHDLILKALSHRDGPFSWESEFFDFRQVNIWPPPLQQPHPPVFLTGGSRGTARAVAARGHTLITILGGWNAQHLFDAYRARSAELGSPAPGEDRFGYVALMGVGGSEAEGQRRLGQIARHLRAQAVIGEPFRNPPGYLSVDDNAALLRAAGAGRPADSRFAARDRDGRVLVASRATPPDLVRAGIGFGGTPDQVYQQIAELAEHTGGLGHLVLLAQGGSMSHADAEQNLTMFAHEVLPRLQELDQAPFVERALLRVEEQGTADRVAAS